MENDKFLGLKVPETFPTNYVGGWIVASGIQFNTTKKPFFLHRWFCRILLGWKWTNIP